MFKRRDNLGFFGHIRQTLWPKMGWLRLARYYRHRISRLSDSTTCIAINLAGGSAMSFTPFFGLHFIAALGFAWLIGARMNLVAAMVGTFVGNPWTFPFFMYLSYQTGIMVLGIFGVEFEVLTLTPEIIEEQGENFFTFLWHNFTDIFLPTAVGGTIWAIISFPFYYWLYFYLVRGAKRARRLRMKKKQRDLFNRKSKGDKR
jgi:uncharacterized protein (DUF2062 family)